MHYIYYLNFVIQISRVLLRPRQVSRFQRRLEMRMFARHCSQNLVPVLISSFQAYLDFVVSSNWTKVALIYDEYTHNTLRIQVIILISSLTSCKSSLVCVSQHSFHVFLFSSLQLSRDVGLFSLITYLSSNVPDP